MNGLFHKRWFKYIFYWFLPIQAAIIDLKDYNEWNVLVCASKLLPLNPVIIQAGGSTGDQMITVAHQWPQGSIYVFEPNPASFFLIKNKSGYFRNIQLYPFALGDETSNLPFFLSDHPANPHVGSLLRSDPSWKWYYKDTPVISVDCKNLEKWAYKNGISKIDFILLNTGGTELSILQTIPNLIQTIQVILIETHFQRFRKGINLYEEVHDFLLEHDFQEIQHWKSPPFHGLALFAKKGLAEMAK